MSLTAGELAQRLDAPLHGDPGRTITAPATLKDARESEISFCQDPKHLNILKSSAAGTLLVNEEIHKRLGNDYPSSLIVVEEPYAAFIELLPEFFPPVAPPHTGISPDAIAAADVRIGENTIVYPGAIIESGVTIGDRCEIGPGAVIRSGCRIGNDCLIHAKAVLYPGMQLGNRIIIHAGAVIGSDGFGYRQVNGKHVKVPHHGTVIIEDDVEIGANSTIDRSFLGATRIGAGTKIDNQVQIAHNCELGKHNIIVSQVGFAGSVTTGEYVICAGQVGIADHVHLGSGSVYGAKAGVHRDMPGGVTYHGVPALPESEAIRQWMATRKLPEIRNQIKQLEKQIRELQETDDGQQSSAA